MLAIFVCQCATSELKARRVLRDAKIEGYLGVRCYTGKKAAAIGLDNMPSAVKESTEWRALGDLIKDKSSYSVIAGWDATRLRWSDVYDGKLESVVPGEQVAEYFAKKS